MSSWRTRKTRIMTNQKATTKAMSEKQQNAFDHYVKLGAKRSIRKVASDLKISPTEVGRWSRKFGWVAMVKDLQGKATEVLKEQLQHEVLANAEKLTDYKLRTLQRLVSMIDHPLTTVHELTQILKAVKIELGEPTEIAKGTMQLEKDNPFADLWGNFLSSKNAKAKATK